MANGQTIILHGERARFQARRLIDVAPPGAVVNVRLPRRTTDQNARLWAMLSDVSRAKPEGRDYPPEIWKALFMASCGHKVRFEPGLDGEGVVPIGFRSSRLTKAEFSDLIESIYAYGSRHGVEWTEPRDRDGGSAGDGAAGSTAKQRQPGPERSEGIAQTTPVPPPLPSKE